MIGLSQSIEKSGQETVDFLIKEKFEMLWGFS